MEDGFVELLVLLQKHQVEFILVGGIAVGLNGYRRYTDDVDIILPRDEANNLRLIEALKFFGEGHGGTLTLADFTDDPGALRIEENFGLDLFVQMAGLHYENLLSYRIYVESDGLRLPCLNVEGLLRLKTGSYREKDLYDVSALRDLVKQRKAYNLLNSGEPPTRHGWRAWLRGLTQKVSRPK
jgi:predicted nucleotidyltransferase